jgi:hypothetical protein
MRRSRRLPILLVVTALPLVTVLLAWALASSSVSVAQTSGIAWVRQFGSGADESATAVMVGPQGDVYVVGWTDGVLPGGAGSGGRDAFARRYAADGSLVWTHQFGTAGTDVANAADVDSAGNLLVAGQVSGALPGQEQTGPADAFVRKYTPSGRELWTDQFGASGESSVGQLRVAAGDRIFASGWAYGALPQQIWLGGYDGFVRLLAPTGQEVFTAQLGTDQHDRAQAALADATGGLGLLLNSNPAPDKHRHRDNQKDHKLKQFDKNGNQGPDRSVSMPDDIDEVTAAALTPQDETIVVGQSTEHGHAFVRKLDDKGKEKWTKHVQIGAVDTAVATATDATGAVYVAGNLAGPAAPSTDLTHIWVQKYRDDGTLVWTRQVATSGKDVVTSLDVTPDGTVYLAGWTRGAFPGQSNARRSDAFVIKLS